MDAGRCVGRAGAPGDEANAGASGQLAIGVRHDGGATLLPADHQPDLLLRVAQGVEHGEITLSRNTERRVHALHAQTVHQNLTTGAAATAHDSLHGTLLSVIPALDRGPLPRALLSEDQ